MLFFTKIFNKVQAQNYCTKTFKLGKEVLFSAVQLDNTEKLDQLFQAKFLMIFYGCA